MFSSLMYFISMLITGWIASVFSLQTALLFSGLCLILIALLYAQVIWKKEP